MDEWEQACAEWDAELITTEDLKCLAAIMFPLPLAAMIVEEIDIADQCFV